VVHMIIKQNLSINTMSLNQLVVIEYVIIDWKVISKLLSENIIGSFGSILNNTSFLCA